LDCRTEGIEEPVTRVDFLLILLIEAEESLYWDDAFLGAFDFIEGYTDTKSTLGLDRLRMVTHTLRGVLVYMCCDGFAIDEVLLCDQ
jgi:hypothetical protein